MIFERIRMAAAEIADEARWCRIAEANLLTYPEVIGPSTHETLSHDPSYHLLADEETTASFFVVLDAINFGSGYFPYIDKVRGPSGYFAIAGHLKDWFLAEGIPSCSQLARLTPEDCGRIFGQRGDNPHASELMWLFAAALNSLGTHVERYGPHPGAILRGVTNAEELVYRLIEIPFFRDEHLYGGRSALFYKRAQILIQDLAIALPKGAVAHFPDLDQLTAFADNVIPYVLCVDEVLKLDPWLEERIARGDLIGSGSTEEIELRACAVDAVEQLCALFREEGRVITPRHLDFALWNRGQTLKRVSRLNRHRTRCVFY